MSGGSGRLVPGIPRRGLEPLLSPCRELRDRGRRLIGGFVSSADVRSAILAGTLGRATASWSCVIHLVETGHSVQASMLARSLFEDAEVGYWVATYRGEDAALERLFTDHDEFQNLRLAASSEGRPTSGIDSERAEDLWRRYGKNPGTHWTRRSQAQRWRAIRSAWWGQRARKDQLDLLEQTAALAGVWNNAMLHHGAWGLRPFIHVDEDGAWRIATGATWHRGWAPLDLGYMSYGLFVYLCAERFAAGPVPGLREFLPDAERVRELRSEIARQEARREQTLRETPPPLV